jgi:hypothetical protein
MRLDIPYSRHKRYLTGNDWAVAAFHHATRRATGVGNLSQLVLDLAGHLDDRLVRGHLQGVVEKYPPLHGRVCRDVTLCPYWRMPRSDGPNPRVGLRATFLPGFLEFGEAAVMQALEDAVNTPLGGPHEHVAFSVLNLPDNTSRFVMTFDHRLFDARGAEMFLHRIQEHYAHPNLKPSPAHIHPTHPAHLDDWKRKFLAGQKVNRFFLRLSELDMAVMPMPGINRNRDYRFRLLQFDKSTSHRILQTAYRRAGYLMFTPYILGTISQPICRLFNVSGIAQDDFLVPVSGDARVPAGTGDNHMFFNHVAFLFFTLSAKTSANRKAVIESLKEQMYDQVKDGLPKSMNEASMLMRILPPSVLGTVMHMPLHGKRGSFGFSHVGESAYESSEFMGREVRNLFHMPRVTVPPAIGAFSNLHNGKLNLAFSYIDGMIEEHQADVLMTTIKRRLIEDAEDAGHAEPSPL